LSEQANWKKVTPKFIGPHYATYKLVWRGQRSTAAIFQKK
jgi:hypothetical protein